MKIEKKHILIIFVIIVVSYILYLILKEKKNINKESSFDFGKWKPDVISPESQLKTVMNIDPKNTSIYATPIKLESNFRGGGGRGGRGGGHHGGGGRGRGGYPYPYFPVYYGGWGGYPYLDYPLLNEPVVINAEKCPEGFVYRGEKEGCKSINEISKIKK